MTVNNSDSDDIYNPYEFNGGNAYYTGASPTTDPANGGAGYPGIQGENLAFVYQQGPGAGLKQTLNATLAANTSYTLTVAEGARNGTDAGPFSGSTIELLAGSTVIASSTDHLGPTPGTFKDQVAILADSNAYPSLIGQPLTIELLTSVPYTAAGQATDWDNVRLTTSLVQTANYGVATFSGLSFSTPGSYTLTVSGGGLTGTIGPIQVVPGPAVQLVVTTEPPADVAVGAPFQVVVVDEDSLGFVNTSYNGSATVALIDNPGNATLGGTLTVPFHSGVATFSDLTLSAAADGYLLQVTSGSLTPATSSSIDAIPVQLAIATQPPSIVVAGAGFGLVVDADSSGQLDTPFDGTISVSLANAPAGAALGGTLSVTASDGVATFSGLTLDTAASGYTLTISSSGLTSINSNAFTVTPAAASQWAIHTQPSSAATAGQAFLVQPLVYEEDPFGNLETEDNSTVVSVTPKGGTGKLQGATSVTVKGGVATFTNLADDTAQTVSLDLDGGGLISATSSPIVVSPAAASQWVIHAQPSSTATAGQPFAAQPVVDEEDPFGNVETGDNTTVVSAALASGAGPLQRTITATVAAGVATFTNLGDNMAGTITLEFTGNRLTSAPSDPIVIDPAAASALVIHAQPPTTATAGQALFTPPVIYEEDPYGNLETSDNSTLIMASPSTGSARLAGATAIVKGGVATFTGLADDTAGTVAFNFSGDGLTVGPSNNLLVSPAAPASWSSARNRPRRPRPARPYLHSQ